MSDGPGRPASYKLPLLPLRDLIIFPHMMMPLFVGREKSINFTLGKNLIQVSPFRLTKLIVNKLSKVNIDNLSFAEK